MNVIEEIEALKKVVEILTPLEAESRTRVLAYASQAFGVPTKSGAKGVGAAVADLPGGSSVLPASDKPASPQEYLRRHNYKIMTKRIAVMSVFLERERGKKRFSLRDITDAFRDAKEPKMPAHSQYARAQAMDYIAREGDMFYATTQAEKLVDSYAVRQEEEAGETGD
jgi:hypothetical protein